MPGERVNEIFQKKWGWAIELGDAPKKDGAPMKIGAPFFIRSSLILAVRGRIVSFSRVKNTTRDLIIISSTCCPFIPSD